MEQLFKRKHDSLFRSLLIFASFIVVATGVFWTVVKWSPWETEIGKPPDQPVPFSHKHHVAGLGIDCRYCHTSVTKSSFAGLPATHTCMTCHSQIWQNASMLEPVRESFKKGQPLYWTRVYSLPKYVYFDHSIHVNKGIGCSTCHGRVDQMPMTWKVKPFFMKDCLECHRQPEKYIRPESEVFNMNWTAPDDQLIMGARLVKEYHIPKSRLTDCYTCHR